MDKLFHSRLFRFLVCLLVICCILVNCSPIRANATVVGAAVITGTGVFATLFAMAMGVVFVDLTADLINGLGQSLENHLYNTTTTDESEILKVWIEPLQVDFDGNISQLPPDQDDDTNHLGALAGLFSLPGELFDNFLSWGKDLINSGGVEVEEVVEVEIPEGYASYNGTILKTVTPSESFSGDYPYLTLIKILDSGTYQMYCTSSQMVFTDFSDDFRDYFFGGTSSCYRYSYADDEWTLEYKTLPSQMFYTRSYTLIWSNYDVCYRDTSDVWFPGTSPITSSYTTTEKAPVTIEPDIYVGDIPAQVKNDTFDDDDLELPYIDYTKIFQGQTDTVGALNNVANQLADGTKTYEQYMDEIKNQSGTNTGGSGSGNGSGNGDGNGDTIDPIDPAPEPVNPSDFFLTGLSKFFPFCIPFDLYDFFACLNAEPEAPKFHWEFKDLSGTPYSIDIDLTPWDSIARLFRMLQLFLFVTGLATATRKYIKW